MYPCFIVCRILGMFPYRINALNIKICKPCYILSTIIISVFCFFTLIAMYVLNFSKEIVYTNLPVTKKFQDNFQLISGGFAVVVTFILSKPRMRLIQTIMEISSSLSSESYQNLSRLIHSKDIFGLVYIFVVASIIFYNLSDDILTKTFVLYNILFLFQIDMIFINCVFVLKACFKQLNDNLINLVKLVTNDDTYILGSTYYNERNPLVLMKLKVLKKQHLMISDTVQVLNKIFSLPLLVTISRTFLAITFALYFYVMRWKIGMLYAENNVNGQIYDMVWIFIMTFFALKMGLLVWACETAKNQAIDINTAVHSVLNSISDKELKRELQLFALQLVHHRNVFSAKWTNIDLTLFTAMVGGITKHLVILIQFLFISCEVQPTINSDVN
ncbi:putative gustatory receptor 28b [Solenopsis invicta]|uniref:putative gustatory receptor 28b n=1 Tax=Solenopsis invicta TaxID=13686 RepID=UPI00193DAA7E|nr:putative gustatory receptor 28b [Solenopsis invicta]